LLAAGWVAVGHVDFAGFVAARASASIGQPVSVGSLRLSPGRWLAVLLRDVRVGSLPGTDDQPMVQLSSLVAEVDAFSLLSGPLVIRAATVEGAKIFLARTPDGGGNWQFRARTSANPSPQDARTGFPTLLGLRFAGSEVVYRTSGGANLHIRLDEAELRTAADDQPVILTASGAYNDVPIRLRADLASLVALRDAGKPYEAQIAATSGETQLTFRGVLTDPLNVDGAKGTLELNAPTPAALLAIAGTSSALDFSLQLAGALERSGDLWKLTDAKGRIDEAALTAPLLQLLEGARGKPDSIKAEVAFDRLDLNAMLGEGQRGRRSDADLSLAVDRAPDTLATVHLTANKLFYAGVESDNVILDASLDNGLIAVRALSLNYTGARIEADGQIAAVGQQNIGRITAKVLVSGMEVQSLRRLLGIGNVPLRGPMNAQFAVVAEGATLNAASRAARASAVVDMRGGRISRRLIEIASTDLRSLFRSADGMSGISCLVAVLDVRAGAGTISPLRIRTQAGTIAGSGSFNVFRRQVDLTVSSESSTTSSFALDVPVRISGSMASPTIRPARWSATGRAELAASDNVNRLLPELRPFARRNPCLSSR
jgi:uncharacterized protein involved in outer membrane biogenesis